MAYLESEANGQCAGSLVAPGYVLTAASCVFDAKNGSELEASALRVWVGDTWHNVSFFNVSAGGCRCREGVCVWGQGVLGGPLRAATASATGTPLLTCPTPLTSPLSPPLSPPTDWFDWANNASDHEPAGNYAVLALADNSKAQWVALPSGPAAQPGDVVEQTAWAADSDTWVDSASLAVLADCEPQPWADEFCAGGPAFLSGATCPHDRGAPALQTINGTQVQVGLTAGELDCAAEDKEQRGFFVALSDKPVLGEIVSWMSQRANETTTGLDDGSRAWLAAAEAYLAAE